VQLKEQNTVQLVWVPGHESIAGNETVDQLAKLGTECPFIGHEPACCISVGVAKKAVRDWTNTDHKKEWESLAGLKQAKEFIHRPSARGTMVNRNQSSWVVGLPTGHCHLKGHLFEMGLTDNPICKRCLQKDESATYILYKCEAIT
jgi:hypothetical protein